MCLSVRDAFSVTLVKLFIRCSATCQRINSRQFVSAGAKGNNIRLLKLDQCDSNSGIILHLGKVYVNAGAVYPGNANDRNEGSFLFLTLNVDIPEKQILRARKVYSCQLHLLRES
jgi:hypothetical protein